ncbi:MAG: RtcB family protein, partial [Raineya sp.]|nr:RtcB family protein [Raineya sp.]
MATKINNNELKIFFYEKDVLIEAGKLAKCLIKQGKYEKEAILALYKELAQKPENFLANEIFGELADKVQRLQPPRTTQQKQNTAEFDLRTEALPYKIFGAEHIDTAALEQMNTAMRLPVAV